MQLKFRFYNGERKNPFVKKAKEAYERVTKERLIKDPNKEQPIDKIFPTLDSYPEYLRYNSMAAFWEGERRLWDDRITSAVTIEDLWKDAHETKGVGDFLEAVEVDENEKAMCYYLALDHNRRNKGDRDVDFRLYCTEKNEIIPTAESVPQVYEGY